MSYWKKKFSPISPIQQRCYTFFVLYFLFVFIAFAQLSDLHFLPPLKQGVNLQSINQQAIYLSTPETTPFTVNIYRGTGITPIGSVLLSNAAPYEHILPAGNNDITLVTDVNTGIVLTNSGLRLESPGGEKFYVNYRGNSTSQAGSLTSKGRAAMGKLFKWGGIPNRADHSTLSTSLGIMATEDNTKVGISGYDPDCEFRLQNDPDGILDNSITMVLNAGETYVLEAVKNEATANIDGWLGATIRSSKDIVISNGGLNAGVRPGNESRDVGIDQPVPENKIGKEYVFIRGNGNDQTEIPIIVGTRNNTDIFVNGSATPIATINSGEYFEIPESNYSSSVPGANMLVLTSENAYAYQLTAGFTSIVTIGMNFIAPLNCLLPDSVDNIPDVTNAAGVPMDGGVTIIASASTPDSNITVTDGTGTVILPPSLPVTGTADWKTFFVSGLVGNVSVQSTGPIAVGFVGFNNARGIAAYYSGFDTVPDVNLEITGRNCAPGGILEIVGGTFDAFQWYRDGIVIPGATSDTYTTILPGDYYVEVTKGPCTYDSNDLHVLGCTVITNRRITYRVDKNIP